MDTRTSTSFFLLFTGAVVSGLYLARPAPVTRLSGGHDKPQAEVERSPLAKTGALMGKTADAASRREIVSIPSWHLSPQQTSRMKSRLPHVEGASVDIDNELLPSLKSLRVGERVRLVLGEDGESEGVVTFAETNAEGVSRVAGELGAGQGSFAFGNRFGAFGGFIELPSRNLMLTFAKQSDRMTRVTRGSLASAKCLALPAPEDQTRRPTDAEMNAGFLTVPALDSRPGATAVLYLDFDGAEVTDPVWGSGKKIIAKPALVEFKPPTVAQITEIVNRVAEDFRPFDVSVTTIESRYTSAPVYRRMRCIVTPTQYFAETPWFTTSVGGAAWLNSFSLSDSALSAANEDTPCWVFVMTRAEFVARAISHELGHALGLWHQGSYDVVWGYDTYYAGHGSAPTSWAPIMGLPFNRSVTQWSKGEFTGATTENLTTFGASVTLDVQDDIHTILDSRNQLALVADEAGDNAASATALNDSGKINVTGIITSDADVDYWSFNTRGGSCSITASPAIVDPNLDIDLKLLGSDGVTVLTSSNGANVLNGSVSKTLAAGTYYIAVRGAGKGDPLTNGWSSYGSLGAYTLTGSFTPVPAAPQITVQPASSTFNQGTTATLQVTVQANVSVAYQWQKQNPDLSFSSLSGKTSATLSLTNAQFANEGVYRVVVTNTVGTAPLPSVTSDPATLTIHSKPLITTQPAAITTIAATPPSDVHLSLVASGSPTLHYQWMRDTSLVGTDSPTLTITNAQFADGASYKCVVSNSYGTVTSSVAKLVVTSAPLITTDLASSIKVALGGTLTLAPVVVGSPTLSFQWFKNGTKISGATKSSLVITKVPATAAGTYYLEVKNGFVVTPIPTASCVVAVLNPPVVTVHPAPVTTGTDSTVTFNATVTEGTNFQWQRDGVNLTDGPQLDGSVISGATTTSLAIDHANWSSRGLYRLVATNEVATAISKTALLTIQAKPIIAAALPALFKIARGGKGTVSVAATGSPTLTYQWMKNTGAGFAPISGAKSASLTLSGVDASAASYQVAVTNLYGTEVSTVCAVAIENPPKILTQPLSQTRAINSSTTLLVVADTPSALPSTAVSALRYQWQKNSSDIPGETNSTLILSSLQASNGGSYRVIVRNDVASVTSSTATLSVIAGPSIVQDPQNVTVNAYEAVSLSVAAAGASTLKYQWLKDNAPISGATSSVYKISSVQTTHAGLYTVTVSNASGSITSNAALLTVNPVVPGSITSIFPTQAMRMSKPNIIVTGTNLNWTQSVTMMKSATASTTCTFRVLSPTQLLVSAPGDAITSSIKVTTRAGVVIAPMSFVFGSTPANDTRDQAMVFLPEGGSLFGNNSTFLVSDATDPTVDVTGYFSAYGSAWHRFTPAVSGVYELFYLAAYDDPGGFAVEFNPRVAIFENDSPTSLLSAADNVANNRFYGSRPLDATQYYDDNLISFGGNTFSFTAVAGKTYWIMMAGRYSSFLYLGGYTVRISRNLYQ